MELMELMEFHNGILQKAWLGVEELDQ